MIGGCWLFACWPGSQLCPELWGISADHAHPAPCSGLLPLSSCPASFAILCALEQTRGLCSAKSLAPSQDPAAKCLLLRMVLCRKGIFSGLSAGPSCSQLGKDPALPVLHCSGIKLDLTSRFLDHPGLWALGTVMGQGWGQAGWGKQGPGHGSWGTVACVLAQTSSDLDTPILGHRPLVYTVGCEARWSTVCACHVSVVGVTLARVEGAGHCGPTSETPRVRFLTTAIL